MEQELLDRIGKLAAGRFGEGVPAHIQARIAAEERHIFGSGHGTLLAVAAKLAESSENRDCPVGVRGLTGNLYLSYLLDLAAVNPMELGLRWEGCLGPDRARAPVFALNVAGRLLEDMAAYLAEILPGYDPDEEHPAIRLCPHALMDRVWEARRQAGSVPAAGDIVSNEDLVHRAYHILPDVADTARQLPVVLARFQGAAVHGFLHIAMWCFPLPPIWMAVRKVTVSKRFTANRVNNTIHRNLAMEDVRSKRFVARLIIIVAKLWLPDVINLRNLNIFQVHTRCKSNFVDPRPYAADYGLFHADTICKSQFLNFQNIFGNVKACQAGANRKGAPSDYLDAPGDCDIG